MLTIPFDDSNILHQWFCLFYVVASLFLTILQFRFFFYMFTRYYLVAYLFVLGCHGHFWLTQLCCIHDAVYSIMVLLCFGGVTMLLLYLVDSIGCVSLFLFYNFKQWICSLSLVHELWLVCIWAWVCIRVLCLGHKKYEGKTWNTSKSGTPITALKYY